jgi:phage N-6-adenine-methyltransferase
MMKEELKTKIARVRNDGRWHSRGSDWGTPHELFDKLDNEFHFTLDVCASYWNTKVKKYFSENEDGLKKNWYKNICWMNPPYGKVLNDWMKKAYEESQKGATVVCLVPAATDTNWWHEYAMKGEIRYLRGRPRFLTKEGTWQQTFSPSVIIILTSMK